MNDPIYEGTNRRPADQPVSCTGLVIGLLLLVFLPVFGLTLVIQSEAQHLPADQRMVSNYLLTPDPTEQAQERAWVEQYTVPGKLPPAKVFSLSMGCMLAVVALFLIGVLINPEGFARRRP